VIHRLELYLARKDKSFDRRTSRQRMNVRPRTLLQKEKRPSNHFHTNSIERTV